MNRKIRQVLSLVCAMVLMLSFAVPSFAAGTASTYTNLTTGKYYIYLTQKDLAQGAFVTVPLVSGNVTDGPKLNYDDITVLKKGNTAGASLVRLRISGETVRRGSGKNASHYQWENIIELNVTGAGQAKVRYCLDGKTYNVTVIVKAYENPVSSITLTGVNGGKNFRGKTKNTADNWNSPIKLSKDVKSATLVVKPAKGWKLYDVTMIDSSTGFNRQISNSRALSDYSRALSSATIKWGKLEKGHTYQISTIFVNGSNGAQLRLTYKIQG